MNPSRQQQAQLQSTPSAYELLPLNKHHHQASKQPLCSDPEGWGPVSDIRWDLTPCFLDVWLVFVTVWGLIGGAGAIIYLVKKRTPQDVKKNWHYHAKL